MAEMERVINPDFIKSLEKNRMVINSAFKYYNTNFRNPDSADILNIFADILNPLYDEGITVSDKTVLSTFRSVLILSSKNLIGRNGKFKNLEEGIYELILHYRKILATHGGLFLIYIYNAVLNLYKKKSVSIEKWISILLSLPEDIELETFKNSGFVTAWRCGAASARENAAAVLPLLDPEILNSIFEIQNFDDNKLKELNRLILKDPWQNPVSFFENNPDNTPLFKTAGGFSGFEKEFRHIPAVEAIDGIIYVTDGVNVFRLHGDFYGIELIRENEINPEMIHRGGIINRFIKDGKFLLNKNSYPLPAGWKNGILSIAYNNHNIAWTIRDSYKIYIAGLRGTNA